MLTIEQAVWWHVRFDADGGNESFICRVFVKNDNLAFSAKSNYVHIHPICLRAPSSQQQTGDDVALCIINNFMS